MALRAATLRALQGVLGLVDKILSEAESNTKRPTYLWSGDCTPMGVKRVNAKMTKVCPELTLLRPALKVWVHLLGTFTRKSAST